MMNTFYIYELWNPIKHQPFYVGLAKVSGYRDFGERPIMHIDEAIDSKVIGFSPRSNRHKLNTILSIIDAGQEVIIRIVKLSLTKEEANNEETRLIKLYGRHDLGLGPLTNLTDGGEGGQNLSKQSIAKGIKTREGKPSPLKGKHLGPYSDERKHNATIGIQQFHLDNPGIRKGQGIGRTISEAEKAQISKTLKGRPSPMKGKVSPTKGKTYEEIHGLEKAKELKDDISQRRKGKPAHNKGQVSPNKGKTYEEIHGVEKAKEMLLKRAENLRKRWATTGGM